MQHVLRTNNLTKTYDKKTVVNEVNLNLLPGEIYGFLGQNGAGKTTTMKMLLGLIRPTKGSVEFFGNKIDGTDIMSQGYKYYNKISCVFETPAFYNNMSGYRNLEAYCILNKINNYHEKIKETLSLMGIEDAADKKVGNYSMGMKKRLAIAQALLKDPELLILDEPTNGLDPIGIKEIRKFLLELIKEKKFSIMLSSHILSEIEKMAHRIGIIHKGRLLEEIPYSKLRDKATKYLEIRVDDIEKSSNIIKNKIGIVDYEICSENTIKIYKNISEIAEINSILVNNQIRVSRLNESTYSLEEHFIKITQEAEDV